MEGGGLRKPAAVFLVALFSMSGVFACQAAEDEVRQRADEEINRQQERIEERVDEEIDERSTQIEDRVEDEVTGLLEGE
jgi:sensor domain CHASE-containing protein